MMFMGGYVYMSLGIFVVFVVEDIGSCVMFNLGVVNGICIFCKNVIFFSGLVIFLVFIYNF